MKTEWDFRPELSNSIGRYEACVKTGEVSGHTLCLGIKLTDAHVVATDDDQAIFRYQDGVNSGFFQCITSCNGCDTITSLSEVHDFLKPVTARAFYRFRIDFARRQDSRYLDVSFWIFTPSRPRWILCCAHNGGVRDDANLRPFIVLHNSSGKISDSSDRHWTVWPINPPQDGLVLSHRKGDE